MQKSRNIFEAVHNKDYNYIRQNLRFSNKQDNENYTPAMRAIEIDDFQSFLLLYDRSKEVVHPSGFTPLMLAAKLNHTQFIDALLQTCRGRGLSKDFGLFPRNTTALLFAAQCGSIESCDILYKYEGDLSQFSPAHYKAATLRVNEITVDELSKATKDIVGRTPLHYYTFSLIKNSHQPDNQSIQLLSKFAKQVDNYGMTALMYATLLQNLQAVSFLSQLESGIQCMKPFRTYPMGFTALMIACKNNNPNLIQMLLTEMNLTTQDGKKALQFLSTNDPNIFKLFASERDKRLDHRSKSPNNSILQKSDSKIVKSMKYTQNLQDGTSVRKKIDKSMQKVQQNPEEEFKQYNVFLIRDRKAIENADIEYSNKTPSQKINFLKQLMGVTNDIDVYQNIIQAKQQLHEMDHTNKTIQQTLLAKTEELKQAKIELNIDFRKQGLELLSALQNEFDEYLAIKRVDVGVQHVAIEPEKSIQTFDLFNETEAQTETIQKHIAVQTIIMLSSLNIQLFKLYDVFDELKNIKIDLEQIVVTYQMQEREFRKQLKDLIAFCKSNDVLIDYEIQSEILQSKLQNSSFQSSPLLKSLNNDSYVYQRANSPQPRSVTSPTCHRLLMSVDDVAEQLMQRNSAQMQLEAELQEQRKLQEEIDFLVSHQKDEEDQ